VTSDLALDAARLVRDERWAALATLHEGAPLASHVAYAPEADLAALVLHLSGMSAHTRDLLADGRSSLAIGRADGGAGDPQTLARITLTGLAIPLEEGARGHGAAKALYLARFPEAAMRFSLPDFVLFRFVPDSARYVGGFARAARLTSAQLTEAARTLRAPAASPEGSPS